MKLTDYILELFYPSRCVFCRKLLKSGGQICGDCAKKLPYTDANMKQYLPNMEFCLSPLYYEGTVRESFLRYKFGGCAAYCKIFGKIMAKCIDETGFTCDIITWTPLSGKRLRKRGYDQAKLLAETVAEIYGCELMPLLEKKRDNPQQSGLTDADSRRRNVADVYEAVNTESIHGRRILLIDDIVTTGSTLSECAGILKKSGAAEVTALTFARKRN